MEGFSNGRLMDAINTSWTPSGLSGSSYLLPASHADAPIITPHYNTQQRLLVTTRKTQLLWLACVRRGASIALSPRSSFVPQPAVVRDCVCDVQCQGQSPRAGHRVKQQVGYHTGKKAATDQTPDIAILELYTPR